MLAAVSCWYVDWAAIGAWVGGIGSASAAICALWIAKRDSFRRRAYAQFLFHQDLQKLKVLHQELLASAEAMEELEIHRGAHPDEALATVVKNRGLGTLSKINSELEYFGRSDMLFEYRESSNEFANLLGAIHELQEIHDRVYLAFERADGVQAAEEITPVAARLGEALEPFLSRAHINNGGGG